MKGVKRMPLPPTIDLNADLGEGCGDDASMLTLISSANIACGGHAGGGDILAETVYLAYRNQVRIGAHPSYPDRSNFGRVSMADKIAEDELVETFSDQVILVVEEAKKYKIGLSHIKPHGALYNDAMRDSAIAQAVIKATLHTQRRVGSPQVFPLMGMPNSELEKQADKAGILYIREGFADRAYKSKSELVARREPHAVHDTVEKMLKQVQELVFERCVTTANGAVESVRIDSLCIHGDTPNAVEHSRRILNYLHDAGAKVRGRQRHGL